MTDFDAWYALYPKKESKLDAIKAWGQIIDMGFTPDQIIAGTKRNLPAILAKEYKYIKLPATYLRKGDFLNELPPAKPKDRTKVLYAEWIDQDKQTAGKFLSRVGPDMFLKSGYTQDHLDGLRGDWMGPREVTA